MDEQRGTTPTKLESDSRTRGTRYYHNQVRLQKLATETHSRHCPQKKKTKPGPQQKEKTPTETRTKTPAPPERWRPQAATAREGEEEGERPGHCDSPTAQKMDEGTGPPKNEWRRESRTGGRGVHGAARGGANKPDKTAQRTVPPQEVSGQAQANEDGMWSQRQEKESEQRRRIEKGSRQSGAQAREQTNNEHPNRPQPERKSPWRKRENGRKKGETRKRRKIKTPIKKNKMTKRANA